MQSSSRLDRLPPYLFAELERKIREKRAAGVDVISLGIGDPDTPTPQPVFDALARAGGDPGTHQYPSNRGRPELREAFARFYERRFGVALDPETEIIPALGAKECVFNLNLAFLDPDSVALAADPGYPVYTGGPLLAGADAVLMPLLPERGFAPDLDAIGGDVAKRARLLYINYPNNPTGAIVPDGLFERAVEFGREHDVLIVHDASYTETTFDDYVAPSFLETPGAKEVGVEVFSLSKGWNMTGWRTAAIVGNAAAVAAYWKLKTNIDSGMFEAVQLAAAAALDAGPPSGRPCRRGTHRRRTASWCSRSRGWSCRPEALTGRTARASSASRSPCPTSAWRRPWSACAEAWADSPCTTAASSRCSAISSSRCSRRCARRSRRFA
jgi:LL-diaminopimelate aminotransferase